MTWKLIVNELLSTFPKRQSLISRSYVIRDVSIKVAFGRANPSALDKTGRTLAEAFRNTSETLLGVTNVSRMYILRLTIQILS